MGLFRVTKLQSVCSLFVKNCLVLLKQILIIRLKSLQTIKQFIIKKLILCGIPLKYVLYCVEIDKMILAIFIKNLINEQFYLTILKNGNKM